MERAEDLANRLIAGLASGAYIEAVSQEVRARDLALLDEVIAMCEKRARLKRSEADSLAEHYGPESDMESSMYDADAMGAEALAKQVRALREEMSR